MNTGVRCVKETKRIGVLKMRFTSSTFEINASDYMQLLFKHKSVEEYDQV